MRFDTAVASRAAGRPSNQDRVLHARQGEVECWAVADGLGGSGGGEVAAEAAVDAVRRMFERHAECSEAGLATAMAMAEDAIRAGQASRAELAGMRSTMVMLVSGGGEARWAHSGDSRLYFFRGGRIERQTRDHSVPAMLVRAGEIGEGEIRRHEDRARLLKSLGGSGKGDVEIEPRAQALEAGDAFLLASDGFWEFVTEVEMALELAKAAAADEWLDGMWERWNGRAPDDADNSSAVALLVTS